MNENDQEVLIVATTEMLQRMQDLDAVVQSLSHCFHAQGANEPDVNGMEKVKDAQTAARRVAAKVLELVTVEAI